MKRFAICLALMTLAGCASTVATSTGKVSSTGKDRYSVSTQGAPVIGSASRLKAEAFHDARQHCASMGKFLQATGVKTQPGGLGHGPAVTLDFKCLDAHSGERERPRLEKTPDDDVIELRGN